MSSKKELVELAEKELEKEKKQKQVKLIKEAIRQTLEKLERKKEERKELDDEIKILKQDIDNIRAGRLDLIEERQKKNEQAKKTSVIIVEKETVKEIHHHYDRWYEPYRIIPMPFPESPWLPDYRIWYAEGDDMTTCDDGGGYITVNCSIAKDASPGTYRLENGSIKSFS